MVSGAANCTRIANGNALSFICAAISLSARFLLGERMGAADGLLGPLSVHFAYVMRVIVLIRLTMGQSTITLPKGQAK
jgi:hypothetical protein